MCLFPSLAALRRQKPGELCYQAFYKGVRLRPGFVWKQGVCGHFVTSEFTHKLY